MRGIIVSMGRVLLIGGSARVGKSTLATRLRSQLNCQAISGDAMAKSIKNSIREEWLPDLFVHKGMSAVEFEQLPIDERINQLRARDRALWTFASDYITAILHESTEDIIYCGGLWPDHIAAAPLDFEVVFLVDTSPNRAEFLKHIRDTSTDSANDWMRDQGYTDERIEAWAQFDIERSRRIIELCKEHNMSYFDIAEHGIDQAQELAGQSLLSRK
jgi:hypothetical protein